MPPIDDTQIAENHANIARLEEQIKTLYKRVDEVTKLTETVHSLALSVKELATKQNTIMDKLTSLSTDVDEIKDRPAKNWHNAVWIAVSAIIGAVVGYVLKAVGLG